MLKLRRQSVFAFVLFVMLSAFPLSVFADVGDFGFFGGITNGRKLPKTTEILLANTTTTNNNKNKNTEFIYKEEVFLSGVPFMFEGLMTIKQSGEVNNNTNVGTYNVTYTIEPNGAALSPAQINREVQFKVNWRREGSQIIKDMVASDWTETITTPADTYTLDFDTSYFNVSIIEDHTPAVTYYRGDISERASYGDGGGAPVVTSLETYGSFYGYNNAWSSTETHRIDAVVSNGATDVLYQVRPSVSMSKMLEYTANEPTAISFPGNFKEVMSNDSGLAYNVFGNTPTSGTVSVLSPNTFEQLIAPDMSFLRGNPAEDDIKRLFAMQILEGEPKFYIPNQAITRKQFTAAVVKALKLPVTVSAQASSNAAKRNRSPVVLLFPDVTQNDPYFDYIRAAYESGIAIGRSNGMFYGDSSLEMQEALVIMLRSLGLENLGLDPTPETVFVDDADVADWAKRELYAAERIGLISADADGKINPKRIITKAEAAALINHLTEYMRSDLRTDYTTHIVDYVL
ncbi:hypothetical protein AGMMS49975_04420 [Clostridia bacterium]|nr:hypothetical protein AGMMS49975_04420 [Clostridia bacterium]